MLELPVIVKLQSPAVLLHALAPFGPAAVTPACEADALLGMLAV
jgi:hypothetical protein